MASEVFVIVVLPTLLAVAAGWDLASFTIPNLLQIALVSAFVMFVFVAGLTPAMIGGHILAGVLALAVGFALFALGYVGGGDAKLFGSVVLWLGFSDLLNYALVASVMGGLLSVALLSVRGLPLPSALASQSWILRLHDRRSGIPYGVALALGMYLVLPHSEIFRLAAAN